MGKWSVKRIRVMLLAPVIAGMLRDGMTLPEIHKRLSETGEIEMALRTFRLYASPIRDMYFPDLGNNG